MDENDFDKFIRDAIEQEKSQADDKTERNAKSIAHMMYAYYKYFLLEGFSEERAFAATLWFVDRTFLSMVK